VPTEDSYGQGVDIAALTDVPDAKTLAAGIVDTLTERSIMRYASASARAAAIGAPAEGMVTSLADTDRLYRYNGTSWVPVAPVTQIGSVNVSFTSQTSRTQTINFPTAFSTTPVVTTNIALGGGETTRWASRAITVTASSFVLFLFHTDANDAADTWASVLVQWQAVAA
jgi:hypothetical protein